MHDLAFEGGIHNITMLHLPRAWQAAVNSAATWTAVDFPPPTLAALPTKPGVYVFFVEPNLFGVPHPSALLYVGKATSIRSRISAYLGQIDSSFAKTKRPYVWRMVNVWHGYLKYLYTTTSSVAQAEALEDEMLKALRPPANRQYPGDIGKRMKAF
jgi:excinuclease UvrABC nuclease subunit